MYLSDSVAVTFIVAVAITAAVIFNKGWFRFRNNGKSTELEADSRTRTTDELD